MQDASTPRKRREGAAGVFHPKLVVQLGRNGGRIIVSSANMTATGLAGNLELAGEFTCGC